MKKISQKWKIILGGVGILGVATVTTATAVACGNGNHGGVTQQDFTNTRQQLTDDLQHSTRALQALAGATTPPTPAGENFSTLTTTPFVSLHNLATQLVTDFKGETQWLGTTWQNVKTWTTDATSPTSWANAFSGILGASVSTGATTLQTTYGQMVASVHALYNQAAIQLQAGFTKLQGLGGEVSPALQSAASDYLQDQATAMASLTQGWIRYWEAVANTGFTNLSASIGTFLSSLATKGSGTPTAIVQGVQKYVNQIKDGIPGVQTHLRQQIVNIQTTPPPSVEAVVNNFKAWYGSFATSYSTPFSEALESLANLGSGNLAPAPSTDAGAVVQYASGVATAVDNLANAPAETGLPFTGISPTRGS